MCIVTLCSQELGVTQHFCVVRVIANKTHICPNNKTKLSKNEISS